jgi:hypothetical protein
MNCAGAVGAVGTLGDAAEEPALVPDVLDRLNIRDDMVPLVCPPGSPIARESPEFCLVCSGVWVTSLIPRRHQLKRNSHALNRIFTAFTRY